jgi:hypothetical protein
MVESMAERYTQKDANRCFANLLRISGHRSAKKYSDVGGWRLDCNNVYGGCVVEEISNKHGAVNMPLGYVRRKPREFCDVVGFASAVLSTKKRRRKR